MCKAVCDQNDTLLQPQLPLQLHVSNCAIATTVAVAPLGLEAKAGPT